MEPKSPVYSIVVPVYNSANSLRELHARIDNIFKKISGAFELILVDDGSQDNSWEIMESLYSHDPRVKIVRLTKNYGQHNALLCGFSFTEGDFVLTMDDDLQNPPEEIPKLIQAIEDPNVDVVLGVPMRRAHSLFRNAGSYIYSRFFAKAMRGNSTFRLSSFRLIKKQIVDQLQNIVSPNPSVGLLLLSITDRIISIPVVHHLRPYGHTTYSRKKLKRLFLNGILYNSLLPLKTVWYLGFICLVLSGALGLYYLFLYFLGAISVSGFTTVVLLILFFSGMNMFAVGILGEYLLRIIQEVRKMPVYTIRDSKVT